MLGVRGPVQLYFGAGILAGILFEYKCNILRYPVYIYEEQGTIGPRRYFKPQCPKAHRELSNIASHEVPNLQSRRADPDKSNIWIMGMRFNSNHLSRLQRVRCFFVRACALNWRLLWCEPGWNSVYCGQSYLSWALSVAGLACFYLSTSGTDTSIVLVTTHHMNGSEGSDGELGRLERRLWVAFWTPFGHLSDTFSDSFRAFASWKEWI
jgi:hypothetical protein